MLATKNHYYLYIENTKILNLSLIKIRNKFTIIYRNSVKLEKLNLVKIFRKKCKRRGISFYIANNIELAIKCEADGVYLSANNKSLKCKLFFSKRLKIIGSAHSQKEIFEKKKQKCSAIIFSRLFKTDYSEKKSYLGVIKFNNFIMNCGHNLIPLGGIRLENLNKLKMVNSQSFAIFSEVKKKPAIISRLF